MRKLRHALCVLILLPALALFGISAVFEKLSDFFDWLANLMADGLDPLHSYVDPTTPPKGETE